MATHVCAEMTLNSEYEFLYLEVEEEEGGDAHEEEGAEGGEAADHQHRHQAAQTSPPAPLLPHG